MDPSATAVVTTLITVSVAFAVFIASEVLKQVQARRERKRLTIVRMLDTLDTVMRRQAYPGIVSAWRSSEVDLVLTLPRLSIDLPKRDLVIVNWVWAQTQRFAVATNKREMIQRAAQIESNLTKWYRGELKREWFNQAVRSEPMIKEFRVAKSVAWKRAARDVPLSTILLGTAAAILFGVRQIVR